ncbi:MAG TPA: hypothetical protein PKD55_22160 [Bellilinea sp.]|nr:hypothetical protein [Bellilinea sp.]
MQIWCVPEKVEIDQTLRRVNVVVPGRADGRTKEHTERYSLARLLASVPNELSYPLMIVHDDRPDFVLASLEDHIGIEHTEIVPENVARSSFLRSKGLGPDVYFTPKAAYGEERKTAQELKDEILSDKPGGCWHGNAPERETADAIVGFALAKASSAQKAGYRTFDRNWLLMYNNWPGPAVNLFESASLAHARLVADGTFEQFDRVYVLGSRALIEMSASGVDEIELVDPGVEN